MSEPTVHERDGWAWINRCPTCWLETFVDVDDLWYCAAGHHADMPNQEILGSPGAPYSAAAGQEHGG